jgi:hypothetical protein
MLLCFSHEALTIIVNHSPNEVKQSQGNCELANCELMKTLKREGARGKEQGARRKKSGEG